MCRKLIYVMTFVIALSSTAHAGLYVWNGSAEDGLWDTILNWTVTDSVWTWPNEENAADPNLAAFINSDILGIDLLDGAAVTREDTLRIGGADPNAVPVLTLDNVSSLTVSGRLSIGSGPEGASASAILDVLGGSTVNVLEGANGDDLYVADDPNSVGTVNIVDSNVAVFDDIIIDEGEGYINISGSSVITADRINIGNNATGVGYLDISGTTTVDLVDDLKTDEGEGNITIGGDAVVSFGDDCYIPDNAGGVGTLTIEGNAVLNIGDDITIADDAGTVGHMIITGNATVNAPDEFYLADANTASATLDISGNATVNIGDDLDVGEDGPATCNIGENATVIVADTIYIPHSSSEGVYEARMTISGNATVTCNDLQVVNDAGNTGYLHISGNPTIQIAENFYMNNDEGDSAYSQVIMDGGTVTVDGYTTLNDDVNGTAEFIMNGGSFYSADYLNLSDNLDGTAHLTMNGGEMITGNRLRLGKDGGEDTGQVRIFMNGGVLQAEELADIMITDTQLIYTGGEFRIGSASVSEADMQGAIDMGLIVAEGVHSIVTDGGYTVLNPKAKTIAKVPRPVDGAEGVSTSPLLSWVAGETAASHDVYIGESFEDVNSGAESTFQGNTDVANFVPELVVRKTYYWRVDEVEADGATVHTGDVWSFTVEENITVDDFEHYNDVDNLVFDAWIAAGGGIVGNAEAPYMTPHFEAADVQAMPLYFDDVSEATLTLDPAQDWGLGVGGVEALTLSFKGGKPELEPGSTSYDEETGVITMVGRGNDIWGESDQFQYAYLPLTGDGSMTVRLEDLAETDNWSKAGIMIRETLDAGSKHASVYVTTPANGIRFQSRPETDGSSTADDPVATDEAKAQTEPVWLKLVRTGDEFNAFYALPLPQPNLLDLAVQLNTEGDFAGTFDTLIAAVLAADPAVAEALAGEDELTVFAPTDDAFAKLNLTPENIGQMDKTFLTDVLLYHATGGRLLAADVLASEQIEMANGGSLMQEAGILTDNIGGTATIIVTDVEASNGVIHAIDTVVLPAAPPELGPVDPNAEPAPVLEPPELEWIPMGWNPQVLPMDPNVFIGLALTSHSGEETYATATMSNLEFDGGVAGLPLTSTEIGLTTTQSPASLYAALEDSAGGISIVSHPDPEATLIDAWTDWTIDLGEFDIDIADVTKVTVGVEPSACDDPFVCTVFNNTGKIDIDDLHLIPDVAVYDGVLEGWDHDNKVDKWDGSAPGEGNPGGLVALEEDGTTYLRLQDTGDPRDYGDSVPTGKTNYSLYLTKPTDFVLDGAIIEFRARIATTGTLDAWRKDGGGLGSTGLFAWPAGGLGGKFENGTFEDYGRGNIGIAEKGQGVISFVLSTSGIQVGNSGNKVSVDDATQWNTYKIEIAAGGSGTHVLKVSANGGEVKTFNVTAGTGVVEDGTYITIGSPDLAGRVATAFDVDYIKLSW